MKQKRILAFLLTLAVCASVLSACGQNPATPVQAPVTSSGAASAVSSCPEESTPASSASESAASEITSDPASGGNQPLSSQSAQVLPVQTDSKEFNAKFAANPIDQAYIKENNKAISNIDMENISNKYAKVWQKEIDYAYAALKKAMATDSTQKPKTYEKEQADWEKGTSAAIKKINDEAQAAGGSMVEVNAASKTMDYYRSRAAQLYRELYGYNKDYSYAFKQ